MKDTAFVPFSRPVIAEAEIEAVTRIMKSGWLTTGPETARFEDAFRRRVLARHALAVNSATAGLHLSLAALGLGRGDEVVTTPLTFCSTVNSILRVGATPVLADVDENLNLDPVRVEAVLTERTRAVLPVHFAGLPCDMERLWTMARRNALFVIEDAAHAAGASYAGMPVGGPGSDAVVFSFYATKNMTTGEGGMITTNSEDLDGRMRTLCLHGMSRHAWDRYSEKGSWAYDVVECGFKYNMTDIAAAIGLCQLARLDGMTARRREIVEVYNRAFEDMAEVETPPSGPGHCWHLYVLRLNLGKLTVNRAEFIDELKSAGVGCSVHFIPIPLHSYYRTILEIRDPCGHALSEYPRLVSLPLYPGMSDMEVQQVIAAVRQVVARTRKVRVFAAAS